MSDVQQSYLTACIVVVATKWNFAPIRCQNHKGRTNVNKSDMSHMRIMTLTRFQNWFENLVRNCISNPVRRRRTKFQV